MGGYYVGKQTAGILGDVFSSDAKSQPQIITLKSKSDGHDDGKTSTSTGTSGAGAAPTSADGFHVHMAPGAVVIQGHMDENAQHSFTERLLDAFRGTRDRVGAARAGGI